VVVNARFMSPGKKRGKNLGGGRLGAKKRAVTLRKEGVKGF